MPSQATSIPSSVAVTIALAVFAAAGCTNSTSTQGGGGDGSSSMRAIEAACTASAQARCDRLTACSPTLMQLRYLEATACVTLQHDSCVASLSVPGTGNTADHTQACAAAVASWACPSYIDNADVPAACQPQTGPLELEAPCVVAGECQSGFCAIAPGDGCGACAAPPIAGDACDELTSCGPGLTCVSATKQCEPFGASGDACDSGLPCGAGLSCVGADAATDTQGTCQPALTQAGATCDPALKTGTGCDRNAGLVCDSTSKTCVAIVIAGAGDMCGSVDHRSQPCGAGVCVGSSNGVLGTCTASVGAGEACDLDNGPSCLSGTRCVTADSSTAGTCQVANAATCSTN